MTSPFERFARSSLELSLMRRGFSVLQEPSSFFSSEARPDLIAKSQENDTVFGVEIKAYNHKPLNFSRILKTRHTHFQSREIPVYTVVVKTSPKQIYISKELADILLTHDAHYSVVKDAV